VQGFFYAGFGLNQVLTKCFKLPAGIHLEEQNRINNKNQISGGGYERY
jgi:hypothetical protein